MAREDPTIYMRIPKDLKDALDNSAAENRRSLTAEVVARLRESLESNPATAIAHLNLELVLARLWNRRNAVQLQQVHAFDQRTAAREARDRAAAEGNQEAVRDLENQMEMMLKTIGRYDLELQRIDQELMQAEADLAKASSEEIRRVPE